MNYRPIGYCRESKENKAALENQIEDLKKFGCELVLWDVQTGTDPNRKNFQKTLSLIRQNKYDLLVIPRLDRLARDVKTTLEVREELEQLGVKIKPLDGEIIDTSTPTGWIQFIHTVVAAEQFIHQHKANVRKGKSKNRARGHHLGGKVPFGFQRNEMAPNKIEICSKLHSIARKRIDLFLELQSINKTCKTLRGEGHEVSHNTLRDWLINPWVYGVPAYGRKAYLQEWGFYSEIRENQQFEGIGEWPNEWRKIRALFEENRKWKGKNLSYERRSLSGLCYCQKCGKAMAMNKNLKHWYVRHRCRTNSGCPYSGLADLGEVEKVVNQKLAENARRIVEAATEDVPVEQTEPYKAILKDLEAAKQMQLRLPSREISSLIDRLTVELSLVKPVGKIYLSEEKLTIIDILSNSESFDVLSNSEKYSVYHDLLDRVEFWNGAVTSIRLSEF